ncbi:MAG: IPT/TIG domain-containing protein, partial [Pseudobacter sp.]|uniref:IPT/TIG domain-containing protein n=1 Tax=Pseudobacter sp. TaxID=2045420 RepID=UPI003F822B09
CKKDDKVPPVPVEVTNYYPNSGQAGTLVTIEGKGFSGNLSQYKASVAGTDAEMVSATSEALVVRMPASGKTGNITFVYADKTYEVGAYTYQSLTVSRVFPNNGTVGSQIRISGAGFSSIKEPAVVAVNGKSALIVSVTDTLIVAEIPLDAGTGPVTVNVDGMQAKGQDFKYQAVSAIKPLTGGANTKVSIRGSGFETTLEGNIIDFNGKAATVVSATETEIIVQAPADVTTGPVSVNINGQKITGPAFTVVGKPVINIVSPLSGPQGSVMTITGDVFSGVLDENHVFINNVEVPVTAATANQLILTLPGGTGSGNVRVVVNDQATDGPQFKDQTLGIASITPDNGLAGSTITVTGTGFSAVSAENMVTINGVATTVTAASETSLTLTAPPTVSTGDLKVAVHGQEALAPVPFKRAGVLTLVGGPSSAVFSSGTVSMAIDSHDNLYVVDQEAKQVKKITPDGTVSVLQANGADIVWNTPAGITIDKSDNIYVADAGAFNIRKITPAGVITVHTSGFAPNYITIDANGVIYAGITGLAAGMNRVTTVGTYSRINGPLWLLSRSAVDAAGNIYYPDQSTNSANGVRITTPGGQTYDLVGYSDAGYADGVASDARFNGISTLLVTKPGELLVMDNFNKAFRRVVIATREVSTLVKFNFGYQDGTLSQARFQSINDMAIGSDGSIYLLDGQNKAIRKVFLQ